MSRLCLIRGGRLAAVGPFEALRSQLAKGGLLVAPVVTPDGQVLMRLHENGERERLGFRHALPLLREGPAQAL